MAVNNWVNKILYGEGAIETQQTITEYDVRTTFDNVKYSESNSFSLLDLANVIKTFFGKQMFMSYSSKTPVTNSKIMEWYQLGEDTTNVDNHLVVND